MNNALDERTKGRHKIPPFKMQIHLQALYIVEKVNLYLTKINKFAKYLINFPVLVCSLTNC